MLIFKKNTVIYFYILFSKNDIYYKQLTWTYDIW